VCRFHPGSLNRGGRWVDEAVVAELEFALELGRRALERFAVPLEEIERTLESTRRMMS
jgi:hypothetical protein